MRQEGLYVLMFALGLAFQVGICRQRNVWFAACLAFPTGLALTVLAAIACIVVQVELGWVKLGALLGPIAALAIHQAIVHVRPTRREVVAAVAAIVAFAIAVVVIASVDASTYSRDSETVLERSMLLPLGDAQGVEYFRAKGTFTVVGYSLFYLTGDTYLWALAPVSALSLLGMFGAVAHVFLARQTGPARRLGIALFGLAAACTMTTYMVLYHSLYVHTNLHAAVYLFAFVIALYAVLEGGDRRLLVSVALFLFTYALTRVEGYLLALIVAAIATHHLSSLSPRDASVTIGAWAVAMVLWFVYLLTLAPAAKLTDERVHQLFAVNVVGAAALIAHDRIRPLRWMVSHARWLVPLALVLAICLGLAFGVHASISFDVMLRNLFGEKRMWGMSWNIIVVLLPVLLAAPRRPAERLFTDLALAVVLAMMMVGAVHEYRYGIGDSGNRMMVQVLPLVLVGLAMAAWRLFDASPRPAR